MADASFFDVPTEASLKKQRTASKYFGGWANIVLPRARAREGKIMYADLFCGPGRYKDGTRSTPLLVLDHIINTPALRDTVQTVFNDENAEFLKELESHIAKLPSIESLRYKPQLRNRVVGHDIIPRIQRIDVPTLFFADPWGYKGISIDLIEASISHWGSDFLFFFNYNRINMNLGSEAMNEPINEFFRADRAEELRRTIAILRPTQREEAILKAMQSAIKNLGAHVGKFTFRSETVNRPTHHLLCVSKHPQGMALFKEISAKESTRFDDNVPSLVHDPHADPAQSLLFSPLTELESTLLKRYAGQSLTPEQIYHGHHNGTPYVLKNYKQALLHLEEAGSISIDPPKAMRPRSENFPHDTKVTFPAVG
jgi:three-Cys-motif partner protein